MASEKIKTREPGDGIRRRNNTAGLDRPSSLMTSGIREELVYLKVSNLIPYKNQARTIFNEEEIQGLAQSIKEFGIKQPLLVARSSEDDNVFEVVSGERRLRAAKMVGLERVPCIIEKNFHQLDEIALIENIQREDLHPVELARSIEKLLEGKPHGAQNELCERLGMLKSSFSEIRKLALLPRHVQEVLLKNDLRGRDFFREVLRSPDVEKYLKDFLEKESVEKHNVLVQKKQRQKNIIQVYSDGQFKINQKLACSLDKEMRDHIILELESAISFLKGASF